MIGNTNFKKKLMLFLTLSGLILLSSCNRRIENVHDLKELTLDENPSLINGLRLGYVNTKIKAKKYGLNRSLITPYYCRICKKGTIGFLEKEDIHRQEIVTIEEFESLSIKDPIIEFESLKGYNFKPSFSNGQIQAHLKPFLSITSKKDSIFTKFEVIYFNLNNEPLARALDENGAIVNLSNYNQDELLHLFENNLIKEAYFTSLNRYEVESIINHFETQFGKTKYSNHDVSGAFERSDNKSFQRIYKWTKGLINIELYIDDYPPETFIKDVNEDKIVLSTISKNQPYFHKGYKAIAIFSFNDEILDIINKEM